MSETERASITPENLADIIQVVNGEVPEGFDTNEVINYNNRLGLYITLKMNCHSGQFIFKTTKSPGLMSSSPASNRVYWLPTLPIIGRRLPFQAAAAGFRQRCHKW